MIFATRKLTDSEFGSEIFVSKYLLFLAHRSIQTATAWCTVLFATGYCPHVKEFRRSMTLPQETLTGYYAEIIQSTPFIQTILRTSASGLQLSLNLSSVPLPLSFLIRKLSTAFSFLPEQCKDWLIASY
jgi:hypothetical protein